MKCIEINIKTILLENILRQITNKTVIKYFGITLLAMKYSETNNEIIL